MAVYALAGNKGGSGKTTLCLYLAGAFVVDQPTIVLNADLQRSSLQWRDVAVREHPLEIFDAVSDVREAVVKISPRRQ